MAFLLWPDSSEAQARTNLRNLLHALRQALPDPDRFLSADTQTLQWRPEAPFTLDVIDFENCVTQASTSTSLRNAVDLYQGDLLLDCYDDWIQPDRERLQEQFIEALERLILLLEQEHDNRSAIRYAERLLHQDPLRESTYRHLMRLYAQSGDRLGVMRVFQTCIIALKRELNVEVSPATQAAYAQWVQMEISPALNTEVLFKSRSSNLPIPLTTFIGREKQISDLRQLLLQSSASQLRSRLITLTGAGGCGKTRLAIEAASNLVDTFQYGVYFVDLASLSDPLLVPQAVAAVFGLPEQKEHSLMETLTDYLGVKEMLLILDNCEHLLGACALLVETLLHACSHLQILATSRERLNITGETIWFVPPLSLPDAQEEESFEALKQSEVVRLFVERASAVFPTFALSRQNAASVLQICRRLDGMPLAIELAAARVRALSVEQIAARLNDRFRLLSGGSRTVLPRHQGLWDLIDWSYKLLPVPERLLLRRLAVFSGGWTLEAAEAICTGEGIESNQVLDLLTHLVDVSMITYDPLETMTRFHMYESIREYGQERLREADETHWVCLRHLEYFLWWTESREPELRGPQQLQVLGQLENDLDNLRTALDWSLRNASAQPGAGLRLAAALTWFWFMKGYFYEGRTWLEKAQRESIPGTISSSPFYAKAISNIGVLSILQNDYMAAIPWLEQGISMWQTLGDELNLALIRTYWVYLIWMKGERAMARALWTEDTAVLRKQNDCWGLSWSLAWMARGAREVGDFVMARPLYMESASLLREVGDEWTYAIVISHLGLIELALGNLASARTMVEMRLAIGRKLNSNLHISTSHLWLGEIAQQEGDLERAAEHYKESLRISRQFGDSSGKGVRLEGLAWVYGARGQWQRAVRLYAVAERLYERYNKLEMQDESSSLRRNIEKARAHLDDVTFTSAWVEGQALTFEEAIDEALESEI